MSPEVDTEKLTALLKTGRYRALPKGQILQSSDTKQSVCLVDKGFIKRYRIKNDGSISIQGIYGPGYIFPLTYVYETLFNQKIYGGQEIIHYEAMTSAAIYSIDGLKLRNAALSDLGIYKELLSVAGRRFHANIQQLENIGLKDAYHRVAHQLLYFGRVFGKKTPKGVVIMLPLTHQDLADSLDTTRETTSLCIGQLRKKGLVRSTKRMCIPDMKKLRDEAYS